jgi:hypothetical protein
MRWEGTKDKSIHYTEDCGIRTNAQRQSEHGDGGETWALADHAGGEAHILATGFYEGFPVGGADDFFRNFGASPLQTHSSNRILAAHTLPQLFFGCHLQEAV